MDDYTKAAMRYRFGYLSKMMPFAFTARANFFKGYIAALYDAGTIPKDESLRALKDIDKWLDEEEAKQKAVEKDCMNLWKKQGLFVAPIEEPNPEEKVEQVFYENDPLPKEVENDNC